MPPQEEAEQVVLQQQRLAVVCAGIGAGRRADAPAVLQKSTARRAGVRVVVAASFFSEVVERAHAGVAVATATAGRRDRWWRPRRRRSWRCRGWRPGWWPSRRRGGAPGGWPGGRRWHRAGVHDGVAQVYHGRATADARASAGTVAVRIGLTRCRVIRIAGSARARGTLGVDGCGHRCQNDGRRRCGTRR